MSGNTNRNYYMVEYKSKFVPEEVAPHIAWVRAEDKDDARRIMEENLDLRNYEIVNVTQGARHMITRQSIVINCYDVIYELEKNMAFG